MAPEVWLWRLRSAPEVRVGAGVRIRVAVRQELLVGCGSMEVIRVANRSLDAMLSTKSLSLIPQTQRWVAGFAMGLVVFTCGCFNSATTRLPQSRPWLPDQENAAYEQQYPCADPDIGPSTESNPRGYDRPRSSSRRAAEQRVFQGLPAGPEAIPPGPGASSSYDAIH